MQVVEAELRELLAYWRERRGARSFPARADIDPLDIPRLLPHLVLVETAARVEDFRYRLFGTEVCRGFDHDRTGATLGELREGVENYQEVYAGYWRCYAEGQPDYFHGRVVSLAKDYLNYSRLLLPLSGDGREVDMIIGGMVFFRHLPH